MMNKKLQVFKYLFCDILAADIAWFLFFSYRKYALESINFNDKHLIFSDQNLYLGLILIPIFWIALYAIAGSYQNIYRRSRIGEQGQILLLTTIGVTILFFTLLLDDRIINYKTYYISFFILFIFHFFITSFSRLILTSITAYKIHNKILGFNTLIIGSNEKAANIYHEMLSQEKTTGNKFMGYVNVENNNINTSEKQLPYLGNYTELKKIIQKHKIEEVIIAIEDREHKKISEIITELNDTNVIIKMIPEMYDIMLGSVKMTAIFGAPVIEIKKELMPEWQKTLKRIFDILFSLFCIILLSPIYLITAIGVKLSSKGPIIYSQERIGLHGKPFKMHKFRSMFVDAEKNGPALSSKNDNRITSFGRFMRKVRLDEIPQFFTVLKGDMSIVGYRPERKYFIDQIIQTAPHYKLLYRIKPGITSWGQVKYGYAENVTQMIERLKYDLLYLENMSLAVDFKILIYTSLIILQGRGK